MIVDVLQGETGMAVNVCNVLMVRYGLRNPSVVSAQTDMSGLEFSATEPTIVQETEFGMPPSNNVSAHHLSIGMEDSAPSNQNVAEEESGTFTHSNANVGEDITGIPKIVSSVGMDRFGINPLSNAFAHEGLSGTMLRGLVELFRIVATGKPGIQICGDANVQQIPSSMEFTVFLTPARMEEFGTILSELVSVLITRFGIQEHVFPPESIVRMVEFGIPLFTLVRAQLVLSLTLTSVIRFPFVWVAKSTIPLVTNANAPIRSSTKVEGVCSQTVQMTSIGMDTNVR